MVRCQLLGTSRLHPSRLLGLVGHRDNDGELLWGAFRLSCCYEAHLRRASCRPRLMHTCTHSMAVNF